MAKLTDIPVVTSLDDADLIYAVDVSDTTDDPAGSSVAITKANFGGGLPAGTVVKEEIGRLSLSAASGVSSFGTIDLSLYDSVEISGHIKSSRVNAADGLNFYINGDTVLANYWRQDTQANDGAAQVSESASPTIVVITGTLGYGEYASVAARIKAPGVANNHLIEGNTSAALSATSIYAGGRTSVWLGTPAAITELSVESSNAANLTGTLILYGERTL